jgi:hypothetical protein
MGVVLAILACAGRSGVPAVAGPDRDGDGIGWPYDACPFVAEDLDGGIDVDGCPDAGSRDPRLPSEDAVRADAREPRGARARDR